MIWSLFSTFFLFFEFFFNFVIIFRKYIIFLFLEFFGKFSCFFPFCYSIFCFSDFVVFHGSKICVFLKTFFFRKFLIFWEFFAFRHFFSWKKIFFFEILFVWTPYFLAMRDASVSESFRKFIIDEIFRSSASGNPKLYGWNSSSS